MFSKNIHIMRSFFFSEFLMGRELHLFGGKGLPKWVLGIENKVPEKPNVDKTVLHED